MKIKVEKDEHGESNLDEIVVELERLGYIDFYGFSRVNTTNVETFTDGTFDIYCMEINMDIELTTLAELRSMNIETLKEMWDEMA